MKYHLPLVFFIFCVLVLQSCLRSSYYGVKSYDNVPRPVDSADIILPEGYKIEAVAQGLNYPTSITFDEKGNIYILEAGYAYGEIFVAPRLLRLDAEGKFTEIAKGNKNGPWTAVDFHHGNFYISEGGVMEGGKILKVTPDGSITELVKGLPSFGDHHTNGAIVKDNYIYFGQGTATNSGVVGKDNKEFGWLLRKNDFHDIPCEDIILTGENFKTENVLSDDKEKIMTGAFVPYGTKTSPGQVIKGKIPCSGAVMRIPLAGGEPELVAWGFRNPYGLNFDPNGNLYVIENGYDRRGSRPVFGAGDLMWKVENGTWYGWPDFSGSDSVSGEDFRTPRIKAKSLLQAHKNIPPEPVAIFGVHSSSNGFDFSRNASFGFPGFAFVAQFGDMAPYVGKVFGAIGFKVVMVDVTNGNISNFAANKGDRNGPASLLNKGGLERPVAVKFDEDGKTMYIVDFGILEVTKKGPAPKQRTGVLWKITKI